MDQAAKRLAEAEESATEHLKRAKQNPASVHKSAIYPVGAEFALCQAESQLMFAVIAVLNQNLTESLKGLLKIRKAFWTLHAIHKAEEKYVAALRNGDKPRSQNLSEDEDDEGAFVDAEESNVDDQRSDFNSVPGSTNGTKIPFFESQSASQPFDFRTITSDPIDLYIHSGTSMSFGLMQLVLCTWNECSPLS